MWSRFMPLGVVLVVVFAASATMSASASALQWLLNGKPITTPVTVNTTGTWVEADLVAGTTLQCEGTAEGTVGPGASDLVKTLKATSCKFVTQGSCEAESRFRPNQTFVGLPYTTLLLGLVGNRGIWVDLVKAEKSGGRIGWEVECGVGGILRVQDKCETASTNTLAANTAAGVTTEYLESETYSCTLGNSSSGMFTGNPLTKNPTGGTISISDSPNR
jgi:hypothetical protein